MLLRQTINFLLQSTALRCASLVVVVVVNPFLVVPQRSSIARIPTSTRLTDRHRQHLALSACRAAHYETARRSPARPPTASHPPPTMSLTGGRNDRLAERSDDDRKCGAAVAFLDSQPGLLI